MKDATSGYLDLWRVIAAFAVMLGHVNDWTGKGLPLFTPVVGAQGVLVFFVLSGFVISYVVSRRESDGRSYALSRLARIYSVAIPALVLTFAVDAFCAPLPNWIVDQSALDMPALQFLAGITFLNEVWGQHVQVGSNSPYWSMGYEVAFYLVFGLATFLPRSWKWVAGLAAVAYGPRIILFGLIWLLGVAIQRASVRNPLSRSAGYVVLLVSLGGLATLNLLVARGVLEWTDRPIFWHRLRDLPGDLAATALFGASILGFDAAFAGHTWPARIKRPIQWTAGCTFGLYLFHVPLAQMAIAVLRPDLGTAAGKALLISAIVLATILLCEVTERRKAWWHRLFDRLLPRGTVVKAGPRGVASEA